MNKQVNKQTSKQTDRQTDRKAHWRNAEGGGRAGGNREVHVIKKNSRKVLKVVSGK